MTKPEVADDGFDSSDCYAARFCNNCDYAIPEDQLRFIGFDLPCPRCGKDNLVGNVYKFGSDMHRQRRMLWELGEVKGSPVPYRSI